MERNDPAREAEIQSVRAWIDREAQADEARFVERLEQRRASLLKAMADLSEAQGRFQPGPDQWSVEEVGRHVAHFLEGCSRISGMLAEGRAPAEPRRMGMMADPQENLAGVVALVEEGFVRFAEAIERLKSSCDLATTYAHPIFGELNCREWLAFCFPHLNAHIRQIERIKASPGFPME